MDILLAVAGLIVGIVLGRLWSKAQTRGVLIKVLDDYEDAAAALYLVLNCQPDELKPGEIVKFQVKETRSQK